MFRSIFLLLILISSLSAQSNFNMDKLQEEVQDPMSYSAEKDSVAREEISPVFVVFRIIGSLALLSVIIIGVVWGLRKAGVANKVAYNPDAALEVLEELPTAPGNSLLLVRFNDKVLLLGQTGSSFTSIETVEGENATNLIASSAGGQSVGSFKANLNKYVANLQKGSGRA